MNGRTIDNTPDKPLAQRGNTAAAAGVEVKRGGITPTPNLSGPASSSASMSFACGADISVLVVRQGVASTASYYAI